MASPQTGTFALGTNSHAYLEFDLAAAAHTMEAVARLASLREPRTTIGGVNLVTGFRPELWAAVAPDAASPGVVGFNEPLIGPTAGPPDKLLAVTRPLTSAYYVIPSADRIAAFDGEAGAHG